MRWEPTDAKRMTPVAVCRLAREAGGRAMLVGGCVRDAFLGMDPLDHDIEVYGVEAERSSRCSSRAFPLDRTGRAFGILKLNGVDVDVSIPRRESKAGQGHRGFLVARTRC